MERVTALLCELWRRACILHCWAHVEGIYIPILDEAYYYLIVLNYFTYVQEPEERAHPWWTQIQYIVLPEED